LPHFVSHATLSPAPFFVTLLSSAFVLGQIERIRAVGCPSKPETGRSFQTTHWSEIQAARTSTPEHRMAVLNSLTRCYWKPVYHYLRARGHEDHEARDITQDFFVDVVLGRDLFAQADPERGRFRPFLLTSLKNYTHDWYRRATAQRRAPAGLVLSFDGWSESERSQHEPAAPSQSPDDVFNQRWAAVMLEQVLDRLRTLCDKAGLSVHLDIFRKRVIQPALEQVAPTPLETLAQQHGLTSKQAANRGETIRRRFRKLLLDEVRLTVTDESTAEEELRLLMDCLRRPSL